MESFNEWENVLIKLWVHVQITAECLREGQGAVYYTSSQTFIIVLSLFVDLTAFGTKEFWLVGSLDWVSICFNI